MPAMKGFTGTIEQDFVQTWHQVLWLGRGVGATVGLANKDMMDTIFTPTEPGVVPTYEFHRAFLSRCNPHVTHLPVGEGNVIFWRELTARCPQYQARRRGCRCPLSPCRCHPTYPPSHNMAAHERCPCLEAPVARKIGAVVYHMPVGRAGMPLGCILHSVKTLHAIFAKFSHKFCTKGVRISHHPCFGYNDVFHDFRNIFAQILREFRTNFTQNSHSYCAQE